MSPRVDYLKHFCLFMLASFAYSFPSSYLSSMSGGDGGMTWMGWAPQTGMTAFASSNNPWTADRGWKNTGVELEPPAQDTQHHEDEDAPPKKWNKPRLDEDEYRPSSSKAEASLNAWFPIMLGLFPPQGENNRNQQEPSWENAKSITALANSVNHGSRGVSSSHAVAYGGEPPNYRSRTLNRNLDSKEKTLQEQPATSQNQGKPQQYYKQLQRYANTSY